MSSKAQSQLDITIEKAELNRVFDSFKPTQDLYIQLVCGYEDGSEKNVGRTEVTKNAGRQATWGERFLCGRGQGKTLKFKVFVDHMWRSATLCGEAEFDLDFLWAKASAKKQTLPIDLWKKSEKTGVMTVTLRLQDSGGSCGPMPSPNATAGGPAAPSPHHGQSPQHMGPPVPHMQQWQQQPQDGKRLSDQQTPVGPPQGHNYNMPQHMQPPMPPPADRGQPALQDWRQPAQAQPQDRFADPRVAARQGGAGYPHAGAYANAPVGVPNSGGALGGLPEHDPRREPMPDRQQHAAPAVQPPQLSAERQQQLQQQHLQQQQLQQQQLQQQHLQQQYAADRARGSDRGVPPAPQQQQYPYPADRLQQQNDDRYAADRSPADRTPLHGAQQQHPAERQQQYPAERTPAPAAAAVPQQVPATAGTPMGRKPPAQQPQQYPQQHPQTPTGTAAAPTPAKAAAPGPPPPAMGQSGQWWNSFIDRG